MNSRKWWTAVALCVLNLSAFGEEGLQRAIQLLDRGEGQGAEVVLLALLKQEPQNAQAHVLLGDVFRHEGNGMAAAREYRIALDLGSHDSEVLSSLATVEKWTRHFSEARKAYLRELETTPSQSAAREELRDLEYKRGLTLFSAYGGWETDTTTKGWQADLFYGGLDRIDPYAGASYADKYFYTRQSYYAKAYAFLSPTMYAKFNFAQDRYSYPVAITPVPDANAYQSVPTFDVELAGNLGRQFRGSVSYEFFSPTFFFDPGKRAINHKFGGELEYKTAWRPLSLRLQTAILRDPDPDRTVVDKLRHFVAPVYGMQYLVGGGADLSSPRFEARILMLPNRDLDRSTDFSVLSEFTVPFGQNLKLRAGHVYDHYSSQSVFSGEFAQVYKTGFSWTATKWMELSFGGKVVRRPVRNDQAIYVTTRFRLPIR
jgi:tetratricopeptide (TPR) repeat protein